MLDALADLAIQDLQDLGKSLLARGVLGCIRLGLDQLLDFRLVSLVLLLADVESDLVGMQVRFTLLINQIFEQGGCALGNLQIELAERNVVRVEVATLVAVLVDDEKKPEDLSAVLLRGDYLLSNVERIAEVCLHLSAGKLDSLADLVKPAALQSNADDVLVLLVFEAALEHLVNDGFKLRVDAGSLTLLDGFQGGELNFLVVVDALVDQLFNVLGALVEVKLALRVQRKHQCLFKILQIVVNLGGDLAGEGALGELLVFSQRLDAREAVGDLVPRVVDELREVLQCMDDELGLLLFDHGDERGGGGLRTFQRCHQFFG